MSFLDVDTSRPDEKSIITYVASYYHTFARMKNEMKSGRRIANVNIKEIFVLKFHNFFGFNVNFPIFRCYISIIFSAIHHTIIALKTNLSTYKN